MNTEKSDIHAITGFFVQRHSPKKAQYFGGFLALKVNEKDKDNITPFNGFLVDCFGSSSLYGNIGDKKLSFDKQYDQSGNIINYNFEKNEDGIWVGKYLAQKISIGEGFAVAKITPHWQGLNMIVPTPGLDGWAHDLVQEMIDEGIFKVTKGEHNEELINLP